MGLSRGRLARLSWRVSGFRGRFGHQRWGTCGGHSGCRSGGGRWWGCGGPRQRTTALAPRVRTHQALGASPIQGTSALATYDMDLLFRSSQTTSTASTTDARAEAARILANGVATGDVPTTDRSYLAELVASRTGISAEEAQKRVDNAIAQAKAADLKARAASRQGAEGRRRDIHLHSAVDVGRRIHRVHRRRARRPTPRPPR